MKVANERGQMVVELAVVMPIMIAVAIIVCDLLVYLGDCARFDRVSGEVVRLHAASASSAEYVGSARTSEVRAGIEEAFDGSSRLSFEVSWDGGVLAGGGTEGVANIASFVPQPQYYTCRLTYTPWPFEKGAFGAIPVTISHERTYCIDPYRPGVFL